MLPSILQNPIVVPIDSYRFTLLQCKIGKYNYHINSHFHGENYFELNYIVSGHGTLISNGNSYFLEPNTFFLHGPQVVHSQHPNADEYVSDYCIIMEVHPTVSKSSLEKPKIGNIFYHMNFFYGKDDGTLLRFLEQIHQEIEQPSIGRDIYLQGLFQQFIITMIRHYCKDSNQTKNLIHMDLNEYRHLLIHKAFVTECSTLTLEKLATFIQCSPRQTQRILQKNYGKSFRELKTYYIMTSAAAYLCSDSKSIEEIAILCGYSSPEQFNRSFKNYYHVTPKQYRLFHRNNDDK